MDAASIGALIASLRRGMGMTQEAFAAKLNVSNKTVSRWESGAGFPEVTQFPAIASVFGVTVDYLMTGKRRGIAFAGNMLADVVKTVSEYPREGMLSHILESRVSVGGCVPNTAIDLAKIDRSLPISTLGRVGDDEHGRFVLLQMSRYGIDCSRVTISQTKPTSYSDVISCPGGERTFFHAKGANAEFSPEDIDLASLNCVILHIGYLLLLDRFDAPDAEYGTVMARFLHNAQAAGIRTSIDVVSDSQAENYRRVTLPALKYCDYVTINELECGRITGTEPYTADGRLNVESIRTAMEQLADAGVRSKVIVHCKQAGFCLDVPGRRFTAVPSLCIPKERILGSVGAGDAFCAGALYSIYNNYSDDRMLEFASSAAACSLFAENATDGMMSRQEINRLSDTFERRSL